MPANSARKVCLPGSKSAGSLKATSPFRPVYRNVQRPPSRNKSIAWSPAALPWESTRVRLIVALSPDASPSNGAVVNVADPGACTTRLLSAVTAVHLRARINSYFAGTPTARSPLTVKIRLPSGPLSTRCFRTSSICTYRRPGRQRAPTRVGQPGYNVHRVSSNDRAGRSDSQTRRANGLYGQDAGRSGRLIFLRARKQQFKACDCPA